jgi:hypothetical protein
MRVLALERVAERLNLRTVEVGDDRVQERRRLVRYLRPRVWFYVRIAPTPVRCTGGALCLPLSAG